MKRFFLLLVCLLGVFCQAEDEVVVYTSRNEHLIKPLFELYTEKTGVKVIYVTDKAGVLMQRLNAEGKRSPADIFLTVDAGNLWKAADMGLLKPLENTTLIRDIPAHLRDPENRWFGLSVRARTIVYHTGRVKPEELTTYADLAEPKWKGRLCLRTSKKEYNQSLVAMMIADFGQAETEKIVEGWVANLAAPVFSNDTNVMKAIAGGQGDVGIVNTYYFGRLLRENPDLPLKLFWPDQDGKGVHVNISGAGITRYAKNEAAALKLLEWLGSKEGQNLFADENMEYPANASAKPTAAVAAWGEFKANPLNVSQAGKLQATAIKLMDNAGYR